MAKVCQSTGLTRGDTRSPLRSAGAPCDVERQNDINKKEQVDGTRLRLGERYM